MAAVQRSSRAEIDLIEIWAYIAKDDPIAADRQLDRIDAASEMLAGNPQGGPRREDLARGLRFYPVGNYLIFYTVGEDGIIVVRVLHATTHLSSSDRTAMTTLRAAIPDDLHEAVLAQAEREHISVDALVSRTLRAAVALPLLGLSVQERGARGNWEDFDRIMARVPDVPPAPGDER